MIKFRPAAKLNTPVSLLFCDEVSLSKRQLNAPDQKLRAAIFQLVQNGQFRGTNGELFPIPNGKNLLILVGVGKVNELSSTALRILTRQAVLSGFLRTVKEVEVIPHDQSEGTVRAVIEGIMIGGYSWRKYQTEPKSPVPSVPVEEKTFHLAVEHKKTYDDMITVCEGLTLTRDLINENADVTTSDYFEKVIRDLVKGHSQVSLEILNRKELKAKGLGLHVAVNQGSDKEPKLIIVRYNGAGTKSNYTAFIGKGMTYDTGGLNLKPTGSMETMRCDMSGGAAVVGTLKNVLALGLKKNILFVVGLAENAIDSRSYKPGEVFRSYNGKTVEIGNTDAEGRLVLADAISYVVRNYKPSRLIDIATLTGACVIALGYDYSGLVTTSDEMSRDLVHASNLTDDRVWRLPTYPEIKDYVKSNIADIKNVGLPRGAAGTLTAAEFLRQFTEDTPWAHLDIAGTAFCDGKGRFYYGHGATGAGVRLMTEYLKAHA